MNNLFTGTEEKEFFVWVDEDDPVTKHNMEQAGYLFSIPEEGGCVLPFIENPEKNGFMSQFIGNVIWAYKTEYNLELMRKWKFKEYPSRFLALFLFQTIEEAKKYAKSHPKHVGNRSLKKVKTHDSYKYSRHDLGWIDFFLERSGQDANLLQDTSIEYWKGTSASGLPLTAMGKPYVVNSIYEILYYGWVKPLETIQKGIDP